MGRHLIRRPPQVARRSRLRHERLDARKPTASCTTLYTWTAAATCASPTWTARDTQACSSDRSRLPPRHQPAPSTATEASLCAHRAALRQGLDWSTPERHPGRETPSLCSHLSCVPAIWKLANLNRKPSKPTLNRNSPKVVGGWAGGSVGRAVGRVGRAGNLNQHLSDISRKPSKPNLNRRLFNHT